MKIVFVLSKGYHYYYYDRVVRLLSSWGHEIKIVCRAGYSTDGNKSGRALIKLLEEEPSINVENAILRQKDARFPAIIRELLNYANFIRTEHPTPHLALKWVSKGLSSRVLRIVRNPIVTSILSTRMARAILKLIESLIPANGKIIDWLKDYQPQVIFTSPFVFSTDLEIEYTKAARLLNIPSITAVLSWDNLTSKGTYSVRPNWLFAWNQNTAQEAVQIHDFSNEQVFIAGAPVYDQWFELKPSLDREAFCNQAGIDPSKPYILYLCSSTAISENEIEVIEKLVLQLETINKEERPSIIIRPHPFKQIDSDKLKNEWVKIFPEGGQRPDTDQTRQTYYDTLYYCSLVIGINTTGFLESAVVDKPCLTLISPMTSQGQEKRAHFKHLMDADFIEVAKNNPELVEIIMRITKEVDIKKENRRKFVHQFIRPQGINIPASLVMAKAIIAIAQGSKPNKWMEYGDE